MISVLIKKWLNSTGLITNSNYKQEKPTTNLSSAFPRLFNGSAHKSVGSAHDYRHSPDNSLE